VNYYRLNGATIAVRESGRGPPLIFVHCSSASHKEWLFAAQHFESTHRCLLPDLIGYGKSSSQFDAEGSPLPCSDADVVEMLLQRLDEPADVVGHSYGALACLEAACRLPRQVRSLFLVEPVTFYLLRTETHADLWNEVSDVARRIAAADAAGRGGKAAGIYMRYWLGRLRWMFAPSRFRQSVVRTIPKVAHEFRSVFHQDNDPSVFATIHSPVTLVTGAKSTAAAHATARILNEHLARSRTVEVAGVGHMMPFTHPVVVFDLLLDHLAWCATDESSSRRIAGTDCGTASTAA